MRTYRVNHFCSPSKLLKLCETIHRDSHELICLRRNLLLQNIPNDLFRCHRSLLLTRRYIQTFSEVRGLSEFTYYKKNPLSCETEASQNGFTIKVDSYTCISIAISQEIKPSDTSFGEANLPYFTCSLIIDPRQSIVIGFRLSHPYPSDLLTVLTSYLRFSGKPSLARLEKLVSLYNVKLSNPLLFSPTYKSESNSTSVQSLQYMPEADEGVSLCIITNGRNQAHIDCTIDQFIAKCTIKGEVLICGAHTVQCRHKGIVRVLNEPISSPHEIRAWITRKKNLLAQNATYSNLLFFHDRIQFGQDFNFRIVCEEIQSNKILVFPVFSSNLQKTRINDWENMVGSLQKPNTLKLIPSSYCSHPYQPLIYGAAFGITKTLMLGYPLNESLFWSEAEDIFQTEVFSAIGLKPTLSHCSLISPISRSRGMRNTKMRLMLSKILTRFYYGNIKTAIQYLKLYLK